MEARGSESTEVVVLGDDDMIDAVELLAVELDCFAFERERVLAKLDIRAAASARRTARSLRLVAARLPLAGDLEAREVLCNELDALLQGAHALLEASDERNAPRSAAPAPSSREAKITPAPTSDVRKSTRQPEEIDSDLPAVRAPLREGPHHRPTAQSMAAVAPSSPRTLLPFLGGDDDTSDFDDETVARKVAWQRSGNRVLGR